MTRLEAADWFVDYLGKHPKRLIGVSVAILFVGFLWHLLAVIIDPSSKTIAFPRSGALLVVFAIIAVFFNHLLSVIRSTKVNRVATLGAHTQESLEAVSHNKVIEALGQNYLTQDLQKIITDTVQNTLNSVEGDRADIEILNTAEVNITYTEAGAGIVGTLVWGFGDLVFNIPFSGIWDWISMN